MFVPRHDPGPCGICGAAHTACTASTGPITIPQLPMRDAATPPVRLVADDVQATLPPGQFTTGTYRRSTPRPPR